VLLKFVNSTLDAPQTLFATHTYDSGFLRLKLASGDHSFTLDTVRRVFGPNPGRIDRTCKEPLGLSYPATSRLGPTPFFWDTIAFHPQREGLCGVVQSEFVITVVGRLCMLTIFDAE
jgi:hypothetical protein